MSAKTKEAQSYISSTVVAEMVMDFYKHFAGTYGNDVMASNLCAVGPLQSMIGLAIANGKLSVTPTAATPTNDVNEQIMDLNHRVLRLEMELSLAKNEVNT